MFSLFSELTKMRSSTWLVTLVTIFLSVHHILAWDNPNARGPASKPSCGYGGCSGGGGGHASPNQFQSCQCDRLYNQAGEGNCNVGGQQATHDRWCYVKDPWRGCPDAVASDVHHGRYWSQIACNTPALNQPLSRPNRPKPCGGKFGCGSQSQGGFSGGGSSGHGGGGFGGGGGSSGGYGGGFGGGGGQSGGFNGGSSGHSSGGGGFGGGGQSSGYVSGGGDFGGGGHSGGGGFGGGGHSGGGGLGGGGHSGGGGFGGGAHSGGGGFGTGGGGNSGGHSSGRGRGYG